jgi:hypothetical protein
MVVKEEGTNKQAVANELAVYSVRALARLGGYLPAPDLTPDNPIVKVHQPFFPLLCKSLLRIWITFSVHPGLKPNPYL